MSALHHYDVSRSTALTQVKPDLWVLHVGVTGSAAEADLWGPVNAEVTRSN